MLARRGESKVFKPFVFILGIVLALVLIYPTFASRFAITNIVFFFLLVPMALGLSLLWGYCGTLSFGQVGFFGISGYVYAIFAINFGDSTGITILGMLAGLFATAIVAAFFGYFVFYGQVSAWIIPVLTLALTLILELFLGQTAGYEWRVGRALLGGFNGINNIAPLKLGSIKFASGTLSLYYFSVLGCIGLFLLIRVLTNSRWGAVIVAIREDTERTRMLGHNVNFIQVVVFVISALLAGLSGLIYVWWGNFIDPSSFGMLSATVPVVYTVVGGKESLLATMLSTASLAFVGDFLSAHGGWYAVLVNGVLLLGVMLFCPRGIFLTIGEQLGRAFSAKMNRMKDRITLDTASIGSPDAVLNESAASSREIVWVSGTMKREDHPVLLEVKNISKSFGGINAISDVSLTVREGELRCLIGPNGAGKSTLFNLIIGRFLSDSGSVIFQGKEISHLPAYLRVRQGISLKFQTTRIYGGLTLAENLDIPYRADGEVKNEAHKRDSMLSMFGLERYLYDRGGILTHVQKQWLEISLALATRPRLLLLDEPTAGMTPEETRQTAELIKELTEKGLTIIVVEHDMEFIRQIADQITVLHQGRVFAEGPLSWIEDNKEVRRIYLGEQ
jgi:branched-chain amino acid transport system permease protein